MGCMSHKAKRHLKRDYNTYSHYQRKREKHTRINLIKSNFHSGWFVREQGHHCTFLLYAEANSAL